MELFADGSVFRYRHHEHFRRAVAEGGAKRVRLILAGPLCKMSVAGDDGVFVMRFPTSRSLRRAVSNWLSLQGLGLSINGRPCGVVCRNNPELTA